MSRKFSIVNFQFSFKTPMTKALNIWNIEALKIDWKLQIENWKFMAEGTV